MKRLLTLLTLFMPWPLRRWLLSIAFGYKIHPSARIGFAWVLPKQLIMESDSRIGNLTVVKGLDVLHLEEHATIGNGNWITAYPSDLKRHFSHQSRSPRLFVGRHSAITSRHLLDCTDSISIGEYTIVGGFKSQFVTHSIDFKENRQACSPISIGNYCFVSTDCVVLGGSSLPDYAVLGAKSLLNRQFTETYYLYGGVPAQPVKTIDKSNLYFQREDGFVV